MSQLVSETYEYNTTLAAIFLKTYSDDMLQCPYKDYSSLNRWQANRGLLLYLLSAIYFSVTMHLRQGKNVDSGPVALRRGLIEAVPIMR
jgi:hypothetical protein